jgi:predicted transcriptional regulator
VSVETVLEEMRYDRQAPPGLTPHLLKSTLNERDDIQSRRNTLLVVHVDNYDPETDTLHDRVEKLLAQHAEPMSRRQIDEALADYSYSKHSIYAELLGSDYALCLPDSTYLHTERVGLSEDEIDAVLDRIHKTLPEDGGASAMAQIIDDEPDLTNGIHDHLDAASVLWALARNHEQFETGSGLLVARRDEDDTSLLEQSILEILEEMGLAYPREIREKLRGDYGVDEDSTRSASSVLYRLYDKGVVDRLPNSAYFLTREDEEGEPAAWLERPEIVLEAADDRDIDTAEPDMVWRMAKFIESDEVDEDDVAERLLDLLIGRDDVPDDIKDDAETLKFALSMGMG